MAKNVEAVWPAGAKLQTVTPEMKQKLSTSIQELMKERDLDHSQLSKQTKVTPGQIREVLLADSYLSEKTATRLAKFFRVPLDRLISPKGPYAPYTGIKTRGRRNGKAHTNGSTPPSAPVTSAPRKYVKKKPNGHDDGDTRWVLPAGIDPPHVRIETSKERPGLNIIEVKAEVPPEVAMGVYSMMNQYRKADEG